MRSHALAAAACLAGVLVAAPAAQAAFPGRDGLLAFSSSYEEGDDCGRSGDDSVFEPCTFTIYRVKVSGSSQRRLSPCGTASEPECSDSAPAWSPGGRRMVFNRAGTLWVMNADGSGARSLAVEGGEPAWSPDGREIVFTTRLGDIAVVRSDGTGLRTLTDTGADSTPAWSTRNLIAFQRFNGGAGDLMAIRPNGKGRHRVLRNCFCAQPDFSPDGRQIAYQAGEDAQSVYVVKADGRDRRRVVSRAEQPVWSPSGSRIAFARSGEIYVVRRDGSGAHRVQYDVKRRLGADIAGEYGEPSWQPRR